MGVGRQCFDQTIKTIDGYGLANPGDSESVALADALILTQELHRPTRPDADAGGHYGACEACEQPWPCPTWGQAHRAAVEWLVEKSTERIAAVRGRLAA